jgi:hypothetical protein
MSPPIREDFFFVIPTITVDTHLIVYTLSNLCILQVRGRYSIKEKGQIDTSEQRLKIPETLGENLHTTKLVNKLNEKNEQIEKLSPILLTEAASQERRQLRKIYAKEVLVDIVTFVVFVGAGVIASLIFGGVGKFEILIKIVGCSILALGAICAISLDARNAYDFIRLLIKKGPLQEISVQEEGRTI